MQKDKRKLIMRLGIIVFISLIFTIGIEVYFQLNQTEFILIPEIYNAISVYSFVGIILLAAIIFYFLITVKTRTKITNALRTIGLIILSTFSAVGIIALIFSLVINVQNGSTFAYEEERYAYVENTVDGEPALELYKLNSPFTMRHIETVALPYANTPNLEASKELAQIVLADREN